MGARRQASGTEETAKKKQRPHRSRQQPGPPLPEGEGLVVDGEDARRPGIAGVFSKIEKKRQIEVDRRGACGPHRTGVLCGVEKKRQIAVDSRGSR